MSNLYFYQQFQIFVICKGTANIYKWLFILYGKCAFCYATVTSWVCEFGGGSEGIKDKHCPGRPEENVKKVVH